MEIWRFLISVTRLGLESEDQLNKQKKSTFSSFVEAVIFKDTLKAFQDFKNKQQKCMN